MFKIVLKSQITYYQNFEALRIEQQNYKQKKILFDLQKNLTSVCRKYKSQKKYNNKMQYLKERETM